MEIVKVVNNNNKKKILISYAVHAEIQFTRKDFEGILQISFENLYIFFSYSCL